jgi:hypothetical protein
LIVVDGKRSMEKVDMDEEKYNESWREFDGEIWMAGEMWMKRSG